VLHSKAIPDLNSDQSSVCTSPTQNLNK